MPKPCILSRLYAALLLGLLLTACAGNISSDQAMQCTEGLKAAETELNEAKLKGFSSSVSWTKAANLIIAANVQKQLERFPSCIDKVRRARLYIQDSQR
jgi:hypothetical protein